VKLSPTSALSDAGTLASLPANADCLEEPICVGFCSNVFFFVQLMYLISFVAPLLMGEPSTVTTVCVS